MFQISNWSSFIIFNISANNSMLLNLIGKIVDDKQSNSDTSEWLTL